MQAKGGGQAWFYHAPNKKKNTEQQAVPPASQIPGLSVLEDTVEPQLGTRNWVRDSDSKYIKLAKGGGRKHLLSFPEKKKPQSPDGPKPYPRVEWFDHQGITSDEQEAILANGQWEPPEYMVHLPLPEDVQQQAEVETYELGQARLEGRGIQQKYEGRGVPYHTDDLPIAESDVLPKIVKFDTSGKNNQFSKLIGGGYGNEWLVDMADMRKKQLKKHKSQQPPGHLTEYQQSIARQELPKRKLKPILLNPAFNGKSNAPAAKPFKLSRFSKVGPKISTRS